MRAAARLLWCVALLEMFFVDKFVAAAASKNAKTPPTGRKDISAEEKAAEAFLCTFLRGTVFLFPCELVCVAASDLCDLCSVKEEYSATGEGQRRQPAGKEGGLVRVRRLRAGVCVCVCVCVLCV